MSDITPHEGGGLPSPQAPPDAGKAAKVRQSLDHIRTQYLAVFDIWDRAALVGSQERLAMWARPKFLAPEVPQPTQPKSEEEREHLLGVHDKALTNQPSRMAMAEMRGKLLEALEGRPAPRVNRLIAGLMVGAFPNVRPYSPETYLEALIEALDQTGAPPAAVAKACNEIVRTCTFPPSVAEVAAKVDEVQAGLTCSIRSIDHYGELLDWAGSVRTWIKETPLEAPDRSNLARPPEPPHRLRFTPGRQAWV